MWGKIQPVSSLWKGNGEQRVFQQPSVSSGCGISMYCILQWLSTQADPLCAISLPPSPGQESAVKMYAPPVIAFPWLQIDILTIRCRPVRCFQCGHFSALMEIWGIHLVQSCCIVWVTVVNVVLSLHRDLLCCENDLTVHAPPKSTYFLRNLALLLPPALLARVQVFEVWACVLQRGGQILTGTNLWAERMCVCVLELTAVCAHAWPGPEGVRTLQSSLVQLCSLLLCGAL